MFSHIELQLYAHDSCFSYFHLVAPSQVQEGTATAVVRLHDGPIPLWRGDTAFRWYP